jgi:hypothetical protein
MAITLQMPPQLEARVRDEAMREGLPTDAVILRALARVYPEAPSAESSEPISAREIELLGKFDLGLTEDEWRRYWELRGKLEDETLTPSEHSELVAVNDHIELANAKRMPYLIELAGLRNVPLPQLMDELGLGSGREARGGPGDE